MKRFSYKLGIIAVGIIFGVGITILFYLFMNEYDFLFSSSGVESLMGLASAFLGAGITIVGIYWTLQHESSTNRRRDMKQVIADKTEQRIMHMPKITVAFEPLDRFPQPIERTGKFRVYSLDVFDSDEKPIMSKFRMTVQNHGFGYAAEFITSFAYESCPSVSMQDTDFLFVDSDQSAEAFVEVHYLPLALDEERSVDFNMTYKDVFEYNYSYIKSFNLVGVSYVEEGHQIDNTNLYDYPGTSGHQIYEPISHYNEINSEEMENIKLYRSKIYYGNFELLDYPNTIIRSVKPILNNFYIRQKQEPTSISDIHFQFKNEWRGDPQYSFVQDVEFGPESKMQVKIVCTYDYLDSRIIDIDVDLNLTQYKGHISRVEIWRKVYSLKRGIQKGVSFL